MELYQRKQQSNKKESEWERKKRKMLCKPNSANVLETIIFLVARHMIIASATPLENLCSVVAIVLLILAKRYLSMMLKKEAQEARGTGKMVPPFSLPIQP